MSRDASDAPDGLHGTWNLTLLVCAPAQ